MPVYEYFCPPCGDRFEVLRPMSRADDPAVCPSGHSTTNRVLSLFATFTKGADGESRPITSGCACGGACACGGHSPD